MLNKTITNTYRTERKYEWITAKQRRSDSTKRKMTVPSNHTYKSLRPLSLCATFWKPIWGSSEVRHGGTQSFDYLLEETDQLWARASQLPSFASSSSFVIIMTSGSDRSRRVFSNGAIKPLSAGRRPHSTDRPLPQRHGQLFWGLEIFRAAEINRRAALNTDNCSEPPLTLAGNAPDWGLVRFSPNISSNM